MAQVREGKLLFDQSVPNRSKGNQGRIRQTKTEVLFDIRFWVVSSFRSVNSKPAELELDAARHFHFSLSYNLFYILQQF